MKETAAFRAFKDLMIADPQSKNWGNDKSYSSGDSIPENQYIEIAKLNLPDHVPVEVRSYFDAIRMLWLFSWFNYTFYSWVDLHSRICVELALRHRLEKTEKTTKKSPRPTLHNLLSEAKKLNLLHDSFFQPTQTSSGKLLALELQQKEIGVWIKTLCDMANEPYEDIKHETLIDEVVVLFPHLRNIKAHGLSTEKDTPFSAMCTVELARGIILQLFQDGNRIA